MGTIVGASETPTVWMLLRTHSGFASVNIPAIDFGLMAEVLNRIQYGDEDRVIDLHNGSGSDGNIVCIILVMFKTVLIAFRCFSGPWILYLMRGGGDSSV
jgi:hypothetical protein